MEAESLQRCLAEDELCGYADGTLQEERSRIEEHLANCDSCLAQLAEFGLAAQQVAGAGLESPPVELEWRVAGRPLAAGESGEGRSRLSRWLDGLFTYRAAAALAAVSAVVFVVLWSGGFERSELAPPSGSRVAESSVPAPVPVEPRGEISGASDVRFLWEPCPESSRTVLTILNADAGSVIIREAVASSEYVLPAGRLTQAPGHRFEWLVECLLEDGRTVTSAVVPFFVGPPSSGD